MKKPKIFDRKSWMQSLSPGKYLWCSCGYSQKSPFCDGAHKGTDFKPLPFEVKEEGMVGLCQCKATRKPPYCDGSHGLLDDE